MKWILKLVVIVAVVSSGTHALTMATPTEMLQSQMGMITGADKSTPGSCFDQCLAKVHDFSAHLVKIRSQPLSPIFLMTVALAIALPLSRRVKPINLSYSARPPDIITLYAHYLI